MNVSVTYHNETFWLTQKAMAELFDVNVPAISKHLTNGENTKHNIITFLQFNEYDLLNDLGKISRKIADELVIKEYEKYRVIQDSLYISDFDKITEKYLK